jgi:hypothetical protein
VLIYHPPHLDRESALQEANKHGATRRVLLGLALADKIAGTALPFDIQPAIAATTGLNRSLNRSLNGFMGYLMDWLLMSVNAFTTTIQND